jgi:hypothetical protein
MSTTFQHKAKPSHRNRKWGRNRVNHDEHKESLYALRHGGTLARATAYLQAKKAKKAAKMKAYFTARREINAEKAFARTQGRTSMRWAAAERIYPLK